MNTPLEIRKESEVGVIGEGQGQEQEQEQGRGIDQPLCSNGCKVGTLLFAGSMMIIGGIIVGVSVGLAK